MSKYGDDLRAIVGVDKIKEDLKELNDRVQILSQRSVAYQQQNGQVSGVTGAAGANGISAGGSATTGSSVGDAAGGAMAGQGFTSGEGGGSGGGSNTPGQGFTTQDSEEGKLDLKEILDNNADGAPVDTSQPGPIPVTNAITGWTNSAGRAGEFRFGSSFVTPDGWDSPTAPADDGTWEGGSYWQFGSTPSFGVAPTATALGLNLLSLLNAGVFSSPGAYSYTFNGVGAVPGADMGAFYTETDTATGLVTNGNTGLGLFRLTCPPPSGGPGSSTACPLVRPESTQYFWPGNRPMMVTTAGVFTTSPRDPNAIPEYNNSSHIFMGFGTDRVAALSIISGGGMMLYEVDAVSKEPLADKFVHIYNAAGALVSLSPSSIVPQLRL